MVMTPQQIHTELTLACHDCTSVADFQSCAAWLASLSNDKRMIRVDGLNNTDTLGSEARWLLTQLYAKADRIAWSPGYHPFRR